ncbi:MAG: hypothetical protein QM642_04055 [Edaphocola sp.]
MPPDDIGHFTQYRIVNRAILADIEAAWFTRNLITLYAGLSSGPSIQTKQKQYESSMLVESQSTTTVKAAAHLTLFGIRVGKKWAVLRNWVMAIKASCPLASATNSNQRQNETI